ncbi:MAG: Apolipoprotein N-acyltransferase [Nocardioidaceae bacterium]|nr:Apolipoprotein N-acyltransferase [Nocardioidaceae bacterium]
MASGRTWLVDLIVVLVSGGLLFAGTGLHPVAVLTWLFPVPLLLVAPHRGWRRTGVLALVAGLLGTANLVHYGLATLSLPAPLVGVLVLARALLLLAYALTWRALVRSGRLVLAAVAAPAAWVVGEWLISRSPAVGDWLSLSTTQAGSHRLLAVAAYAGSSGLSFLVVGVAAAACALALGVRRRTVVGPLVWLVLLVVVAPVSAWAVAQTPDGPAVRVAAVAVPQPYDPVDVDTAAGQRLVDRFVAEVDRLASQGAEVVVLPEKSFASSGGSGWLAPLQAVADQEGVVVVVGTMNRSGGTTENLAIALRPRARAVEYRKQHLVPSYESDFTPGTELAGFGSPAGRWGLAVCKDLDFPALTRAYARSGTGLLAVPAWDFDTDAWLHSRIAVVRGVETGTTVVRSARNGALTVSDPTGRVLVDHRTAPREVTSVLVTVAAGSHDTVYDRSGDWFVVLCGIVVGIGWLIGPLRRAAGRTSARGSAV